MIHNPITDYERYSCEWGYALNSQAGELIRVIDLAHTSLPSELTRIPQDFWLIDGHQVVAMHYGPDGRFHGGELLDPRDAAEYQVAAEVAWELSDDFTTWWNQHPQHHRAVYKPPR